MSKPNLVRIHSKSSKEFKAALSHSDSIELNDMPTSLSDTGRKNSTKLHEGKASGKRTAKKKSVKKKGRPESKIGDGVGPSAPGAPHGDNHNEGGITDSKEVGMTDAVFERTEMIEQDFESFKQFTKAETKPFAHWIKDPETEKNIIEWAAEQKDIPDWIRRPNATSDRELLQALNGHDRGFDSNVTVHLGGHVVEKGEIMFLRNNTHWEARGEGRYRFWSHWTSVMAGRKNLNETYISMAPRCPITIVMILPGKIGIAKLDMNPIILLPGRHAFNNPLFEFSRMDIYDITSPLIEKFSITLVNIKPDQVGFAQQNNQFFLLKPGLHFTNDPSFVHEITYKMSEVESGNLATQEYGRKMADSKHTDAKAYVTCGTITLAQVHPSEYGCAYIEGAPKFLKPGFYARNSPSFNFDTTHRSNEEYIHFGTLHIVNIRKGMLALLTNRNHPLLVEGPAVIRENSHLFEFVRTYPADTAKIVHKSITRFVIQTGQIGFAQCKGVVEKLDPGIRVVDNPDFEFLGTFPEKQPLIRSGQYTLITVQDGHLAPVWENGVLEMVKPGFKMYETPNIFVGPIVDLYPPIISFRKIDAYTRDRSQMQISGQLEYIVEDAHLLVTSIGVDHMISSLEKRIHAILRHHLAITDLSSISSEHRGVESAGIQKHVPKQKASAASQDGDTKDNQEEEPDFRDELGAQGTKELQADATRWGLKVIKMEVSDIHYKDDEVEEAIASRTTQTRIAESDFDLSVVRNRQKMVDVEAQARKEYIEAESQANQALITKKGHVKTFKIQNDIGLSQRKTKVEAEKLAILGKAEADAAKIIRAAEANAQAVEIRADAKLKATLKIAEGETKLLQVEHERYGGADSLLKLEKMKLKVKMVRALAKAAVPTVSLNATGNGESSFPGGAEGAMAGMMRTKGQKMMKTVTAVGK